MGRVFLGRCRTTNHHDREMRFDPNALRRLTLLILFLLPLAAATSGCNHGPAMAQVRGTVHYKDGSVPKGAVAVVRFAPADDTTATVRKGATGAIGPDGSFEMMTRMPGDGVYLGTYNVTFTVLRDPMNPTSSMILPKYNNAATSGYKINVDGNKEDEHYEIEPMPGVTDTSPGKRSHGPRYDASVQVNSLT